MSSAPLTAEERDTLEESAKHEPDNIRQIADGLKGEARDRYLLALRERPHGLRAPAGR